MWGNIKYLQVASPQVLGLAQDDTLHPPTEDRLLLGQLLYSQLLLIGVQDK